MRMCHSSLVLNALYSKKINLWFYPRPCPLAPSGFHPCLNLRFGANENCLFPALTGNNTICSMPFKNMRPIMRPIKLLRARPSEILSHRFNYFSSSIFVSGSARWLLSSVEWSIFQYRFSGAGRDLSAVVDAQVQVRFLQARQVDLAFGNAVDGERVGIAVADVL